MRVAQRKFTNLMAASTVIGVLAAACGSGGKLTSDQQRGRRIYESLCDKCHKLIPPKQHTDEEWLAAADKYGVKLQLQPNEIALLKSYLTRANDTLPKPLLRACADGGAAGYELLSLSLRPPLEVLRAAMNIPWRAIRGDLFA